MREWRIERAVARGEIDPGQFSARVAGVPVDLFRYELMMTLPPLPERVIGEIADDVFLPLVRQAPQRRPDCRAHVDSAGEL